MVVVVLVVPFPVPLPVLSVEVVPEVVVLLVSLVLSVVSVSSVVSVVSVVVLEVSAVCRLQIEDRVSSDIKYGSSAVPADPPVMYTLVVVLVQYSEAGRPESLQMVTDT